MPRVCFPEVGAWPEGRDAGPTVLNSPHPLGFSMNNSLAIVAALALAASFAAAQTDQPADQPAGQPDAASTASQPAPELSIKPLLAVGDKAPALLIEKWVKGEPVTGFEKGKVYVVEFWATWCGPCIKSMPHLTELQRTYKDRGLTIIGVTSADRSNTLAAVEKMVAEKGDLIGYTVAWDTERKTSEAFMLAANQNGIPCSFVVNQEGIVSYIGHPMLLDEVIPRVLEGKWDAKADPAKLETAMGKLEEIFGTADTDPKGALKAYLALETEHPAMLKDMQAAKLSLLVKAGEFDSAIKSFDAIFAKASKDKEGNELAGLAMMLGDKTINPDKKMADQALKAAQEAIKISGDTDVQALIAMAFAHKIAGQKDLAIEFATKADGIAEGGYKQFTQYQLEQIKAD